MKRKFEVGEKVACYSIRGREIGVIQHITGYDVINVKLPGDVVGFHKFQLRRLIPKPAERKPDFDATISWQMTQSGWVHPVCRSGKDFDEMPGLHGSHGLLRFWKDKAKP